MCVIVTTIVFKCSSVIYAIIMSALLKVFICDYYTELN